MGTHTSGLLEGSLNQPKEFWVKLSRNPSATSQDHQWGTGESSVAKLRRLNWAFHELTRTTNTQTMGSFNVVLEFRFFCSIRGQNKISHDLFALLADIPFLLSFRRFFIELFVKVQQWVHIFGTYVLGESFWNSHPFQILLKTSHSKCQHSVRIPFNSHLYYWKFLAGSVIQKPPVLKGYLPFFFCGAVAVRSFNEYRPTK